MNKNIFLRTKTNVINNKPVNRAASPPPIKSNKFNPDVMENYNQVKEYKIGEINYSNQTWKGITGSELNFAADCSENFKLQFEKVDTVKLSNDFTVEFEQRERERLITEEKNRQIKERMLENVLVMTDEICDGNTTIEDLPEYSTLKIESCANVLLDEQEEYNKLLREVGNL